MNNTTKRNNQPLKAAQYNTLLIFRNTADNTTFKIAIPPGLYELTDLINSIQNIIRTYYLTFEIEVEKNIQYR